MAIQPSDRRVPRKEISYETDSRYHHAGEWYSGWSYSEHRGYREEQEFREGFRWGAARMFGPDGRLVEESGYRMDLLHGPRRSWNDEGRLTHEAVYEHGIMIGERKWDDAGHLVVEFARPDGDADLLEMRRLYGTPEQVAAEEAAYRGAGTDG
jgi:antitoxin component YwqK of YwqJK toxin-antitoxin module